MKDITSYNLKALFISIGLFLLICPTLEAFAQTDNEYFDHAQALFIKGDYNGSVDYLQKSIELGDNKALKAEAYANIAMIYNLQHNYQGAITNSKKATQVDPVNMKGYLEMGAAYLALGDKKNALTSFDTALILDSKNPRALAGRGIAKNGLGDLQGAMIDFELVILVSKSNPHNPETIKAYLGRGTVKYKLGDKASGCSDFTKASELGSLLAKRYLEELCK